MANMITLQTIINIGLLFLALYMCFQIFKMKVIIIGMHNKITDIIKEKGKSHDKEAYPKSPWEKKTKY